MESGLSFIPPQWITLEKKLFEEPISKNEKETRRQVSHQQRERLWRDQPWTANQIQEFTQQNPQKSCQY